MRYILAVIGVLTCGGAAAQNSPPVVGVLVPSSQSEAAARVTSLRAGIKEAGLVEGKDLQLEVRWSGGDDATVPALAAELSALKPRVLVSSGHAAIIALRQAAPATPLVMAIVADPVAVGYAQSLARPGGNLTGLSNLASGLIGKRIELLAGAIPGSDCISVLHNPKNSAVDDIYLREAASAVSALGRTLRAVTATSVSDFEAAFAEMARQHCAGVLVMADPFYTSVYDQLVAFSARHQMPAIYDYRSFVEAGGLMSYGPDLRDMYRRAASYVAKILKGAAPSDLPIEQATKFELVVNLRTARALGLSVPPSILARADEVIE